MDNNKRKKIALAIEHFNKYKGGAESYAVSLAATLADKGWEVHFFGQSWDGEPHSAVFHEIKIPKLLPSWVKMLMFAIKHKQMVMKQNFDVVLGFGNTIYMNVYQSHGGVHRYSTDRKVYSERNIILRFVKRLLIFFSIKDKVRNWIESAPFRLNPRPEIIAISQMVREDMASYFRNDEKDINLIYNGIDTAKYNKNLRNSFRGTVRQQLSINDDDIAFIFSSYTLKKKGIEPLIETTAQLKKENIDNFKIIVLGAQPYPSLLRKIARLDLKDTVIFLGPIKAPEKYYAACDALIMPTYYDTCSLVVIEAMACGLPTITTVCCGAAGIITTGKDGYIISHPPVPEDLLKVMTALLSRERLKKMSIEAALKASKYSTKENHREMIKVFDEVAEKKSPT